MTEMTNEVYSLELSKDDIESIINCIDDSINQFKGESDEDLILYCSEMIILKRALKEIIETEKK